MKKTYTKANDEILLKDNQIYIFSEGRSNMLYTTDNLYVRLGVEEIDRCRFINPVDVFSLAKKKFEGIGGEAAFFSEAGFIEGYNYKETGYTKDEVISLMTKAHQYGELSTHTGLNMQDKYCLAHALKLVDKMHTLCCPESVTIIDNIIKEVKWIK